MGDCRLKVSIAKELLPKDSDEARNCSDRTLSVTSVYTADTTIREVAEDTKLLWALFSSQAEFCLWDCTFHPPKNITDWVMKEFPDLQGPKSKTLHDAGCFPSGTWIALPKDVPPNQFKSIDYDDAQYNNKNSNKGNSQLAINSSFVQFKDSTLAASKPLPSQVMESVAKRFAEEDGNLDAEAEKARFLRRQNRENKKKIQQERAAKLDQRIQKLEEQSSEKNKTVSDQVRRMLIKSRATGDKNLKMQDRIYFQCMLDNGDDITKEYRYFSPQDTFSKIASSFPSQGSLQSSEVLVQRKSNEDNSTVYRRFPVAMRVYEAISGNYLTDQFDTMIIRLSREGEDATPSILEEVKMDTKTRDVEDIEMKDVSPSVTGEKVAETNDMPNLDGCVKIDKELTALIYAMDVANNKGKKPKKKSSATTKVRNMQMKSKAKGDSKRVPKIENRFFLEVVLIGIDGKASSSFQFLARTDPIQRLLQNLSMDSKQTDWDFLTPIEADADSFKVISETSMTLDEAEKKGILHSFDRIIVSQSKKV